MPSLALLLPLLLGTGPQPGEGNPASAGRETRVPASQAVIARPATPVPGDSSCTHVRQGEYECRLGKRRKYLLHLPASADTTRPLPLVLFFHGGGGSMEQGARDYGWRETADREGFVVAFPNGWSRWRGGRLATWNAGRCCGDARDRQIDDVAFVGQMVADIRRQVRIDPARIFATGMSNGGMMSHRLACEMAGTFRAVAAVAGTDNTLSCSPGRPISVLHIHARDDTHVLFNGGAGKDAFRDEEKVTDFTSVPETVRRWVERIGATPTPRRVLEVPGASADLYRAPGGAEVELVVTETGGHSWPGGKRARGKEPSRAIVANDLIWEFFVRQGRTPRERAGP